jgi:hypothetical protein
MVEMAETTLRISNLVCGWVSFGVCDGVMERVVFRPDSKINQERTISPSAPPPIHPLKRPSINNHGPPSPFNGEKTRPDRPPTNPSHYQTHRHLNVLSINTSLYLPVHFAGPWWSSSNWVWGRGWVWPDPIEVERNEVKLIPKSRPPNQIRISSSSTNENPSRGARVRGKKSRVDRFTSRKTGQERH